MTCSRARQQITESLAGNLEPAARSALDAHLASCAPCRAEADAARAIWARLGRAPDPTPPADAWSSFAARLDREAGWRGRRRRPAVVAAAALVLFAGGVITGRITAPATAPDDSAAEYLLLLRGADRADGDDVVEEYAGWARALAADGRLIGADRLAPEAVWLEDAADATRSVPTRAPEPVAGFFLVTARDDAHAVATARASPHLRYGGVVEIRRVVH